MQVTRIRKGMLWTLVMVLLCTMLPVAMAAQTTLSVSFNGLRATSEGQWMTEPLTGTFEVWSGTTLLGQVTAHPQDGSADTLALSSTEEITLRPVMETMPGWKCDISGVRKWEDLPEAARNYVEYVEREIGCHITYVSVGPERDSIIIR